VNTQPFTKFQIFAAIWMAVVIAYLFNGPRGYGAAPTPIAFLTVGSTVFALFTLGKRFRMFGLFLLMVISSLVSGGRRGRRW
jgi:hypothetical protein